jgi:hypothetical protein
MSANPFAIDPRKPRVAAKPAELVRTPRHGLAQWLRDRKAIDPPDNLAAQYVDGALVMLATAAGYIRTTAALPSLDPADRQTVDVIRANIADMVVDLGAVVRLLREDSDSAALASIFSAAGVNAKPR